MGLLKVGRPLTWEESLDHLNYVREHGILQFLHIYETMKEVTRPDLKWGEEVEYGIFKVDHEARTVRVSLRGAELMHILNNKENDHHDRFEGCTWQPEFGAWMIESTPIRPYTGYANDLLRVESNMKLRRKRLLSVLEEGEICPTVTAFPMLGVGSFTDPPHMTLGGPVSLSDSIPDGCINAHPRFATLVRNIRVRRGGKVDIRVPLYEDKETREFLRRKQTNGGGAVAGSGNGDDVLVEEQGYVWQLDGVDDKSLPTSPAGKTTTPTKSSLQATPPPPFPASPSLGAGDGGGAGTPFVHMDAMAYGMGCCCLQVTFQARDVSESRYMYDQLGVLAPIMLSLTAATPILKGRLVDTDVRWNTIAGSVDDRTPAERGELNAESMGEVADDRMAGRGIRRLYKSRYDAISCYIYSCKDRPAADRVLDQYNDAPVEVDDKLLTLLKERGVDSILARHVAHLFTRDPLVVFDGAVEVDDSDTTEHFENIQSTNWQTVRWKPPPLQKSPTDPRIGWRTEFRSMEIQLTDFENAAFTVFVVLLTRVILAFDLHLYIPISKNDENMARAHARNSVLTQRFYFRKHMASVGDDGGGPSHCFCSEVQDYEEMTIAEIMLGKGSYFPGLILLCNVYLDYIGCDRETQKKVAIYLDFIKKRATGEIKTAASWMRDFVTHHPEYQHDSIITQGIAYDLLMECKAIGEGKKRCRDLLGDSVVIDPVVPEEAYDVLLSSSRLGSSERAATIAQYLRRAEAARRRKSVDYFDDRTFAASK